MIEPVDLRVFEFRDENGLVLGQVQLPSDCYEAAYQNAEKLAAKFHCPVTIVEVKDTARPVMAR